MFKFNLDNGQNFYLLKTLAAMQRREERGGKCFSEYF